MTILCNVVVVLVIRRAVDRRIPAAVRLGLQLERVRRDGPTRVLPFPGRGRRQVVGS